VAPVLLLPPLGIQAPITDLERLWLETTCYYAVFDDNVMEDTLWDYMAVELWERRLEISPYFAHAVGLPWPCPMEFGEEGENPLKTAAGVDWEKGLPAIVVEGIRKDGPKRLAQWRTRIETIQREHREKVERDRLIGKGPRKPGRPRKKSHD